MFVHGPHKGESHALLPPFVLMLSGGLCVALFDKLIEMVHRLGSISAKHKCQIQTSSIKRGGFCCSKRVRAQIYHPTLFDLHRCSMFEPPSISLFPRRLLLLPEVIALPDLVRIFDSDDDYLQTITICTLGSLARNEFVSATCHRTQEHQRATKSIRPDLTPAAGMSSQLPASITHMRTSPRVS